MENHRAASKIEKQFREPNLCIHKIVNTAIELGCTDKVVASREVLLGRLVSLYGESEKDWEKRLVQAFSNEGNAYGQYFCRTNSGIVFHPAVWHSIKRVGWDATSSRSSVLPLSEKLDDETSGDQCADMKKQTSRRKRNSLQVNSWGTFGLEIIGSSTPHKDDFFRADVSVARLDEAVKSGSTFLFVYVNNGTRAFAIPAHTLQAACISHNVSINTNGTPRYELYINHKQAVICKNASLDGKIAEFSDLC